MSMNTDNPISNLQSFIDSGDIEFNSTKQIQEVADRLLSAVQDLSNATEYIDDKVGTNLGPVYGDVLPLGGLHSVYKSSTLLMVHVLCMAIAWPLLASTAIFMAGHFKVDHPTQKLCGRPLWYQIHRWFMVLVVILNLVGTLAVFAMQDSYIGALDGNSCTKSHAPIGVAVLCLTCLNPALAAFRPLEDAPGKIMFDWFHWLVGQSAYGLAILDVFMGMLIPRANFLTPDWLISLLALFVVFHVAVEFFLTAEQKYNEGQSKAEERAILVSEMGVHHIASTEYPLKPSRRHVLRKLCGTIYLTCVLAIGIVFITTVLMKNHSR